ncbi:GNAT family N-acetyltransferase [Reinekea sp.]|jgi:predicted acetyltransferase|uniref:GNAT family N-acetyltransferase n=1 Tax=Reinekea sp. TaxID=1970455 RepID=UPI00398917FD
MANLPSHHYTYPGTQTMDPIVGDEVALVLNRVLNSREGLDGVPALLYDIVLHDGSRIGQIDFRLKTTPSLIKYGGQIGYGINKPYRGRGFAAQACELIKVVAKEKGFDALWITCNPDNIASIKTLDKIGAQFVEQVLVPKDTELWHRGDREKLRYLWRF